MSNLYIAEYSDGWCGTEETFMFICEPADIYKYLDELGQGQYTSMGSDERDRRLACDELDYDSEEGQSIDFEECYSTSEEEFDPENEEHRCLLKDCNDTEVINFAKKYYPGLET